MKQRNSLGSINPRGVTRRKVLCLAGSAFASAAVGPFVMRVAKAGDAFSWQRFKGSKIFFQFLNIPWATMMEKQLPDFEKETGIRVEFSDLPEIQARQKITVEFVGGSGGVDGWLASIHVEKRRFWKAGWFADLRKFLQDPTMTAPDYDWNDMAPLARDIVTQPDESICAVPIWLDTMIFMYRKDLVESKGLKRPERMADIAELAQALHQPPAVYGFVGRGLKNANAMPFAYALFAMGGDYLTKDGKASLNTPAAVQAMDWYVGLLRRFGPPGVVNYQWYDVTALFMQGRAGMFSEGVSLAGPLEDPEKSKVVGRVGYSVLPPGPGGQFSPVAPNALSISAQSKNQGPAYFFIQWASSKPRVLKQLLEGLGSPRTSVWKDPQVKAKTKMPAEYARAYEDSIKVGRLCMPEVVGVTEYRDIIGVAIQKAIEGAKSEDVLAQAQKEFQSLLDHTEN